MIELPDGIAPNGASFTLVDMGFMQDGATGLGDRIDRPGNHFMVELDFPPMKPARADIFAARVERAVRQGLRVDIPLLGVSQGNPGSPVVDGDEPSGTTLPLRGLNPGYVAKEGYKLTVVEGATGQRCTHRVAAPARVEPDGTVILDIEPPLRVPLADGDLVNLARPTIEGAVRTPPAWMLATDRLVRLGAKLTIEEVAGIASLPLPTFDDASAPPTFDMDA